MNLKVISCAVFNRELRAAADQSPHQVEFEFLPQGLHNVASSLMRARLQEAVDRVDPSRFDAILLGYGLCSNGLHGLRARELSLVLPRAHDCITLFFGSRQRYLGYFHKHPGVYFKTSGWIECADDSEALTQLSIEHVLGMDQSYAELVEKHGEDNARYIIETLKRVPRRYGQFTFIEMGVEPDDRFERMTRAEATERGWSFEKVKGDMSLIQRLLSGDWNELDFLVVKPGQQVAARYGEAVVCAETAADDGT